MMNTNNMNNSRERALKRVQEYSFAVDEARLYLDMHPDDEQAVKDGWKWTQGPMPWEMGV